MKVHAFSRIRKHERGMSLLETLVAAAVMLVGIGGVMSLFMVAAIKNQSQGSQATRCTEYAQDKLEQLMALSYTNALTDTYSDTTQIPTSTVSTCTTPVCTGLANGGNTTTPTTGYMDYVTEGTGVGAAIYATKQSNSNYQRLWSIAQTGSVKTITVTVTALGSVDKGLAPSTTLASQKTSF